jgi:hypothetical protein
MALIPLSELAAHTFGDKLQPYGIVRCTKSNEHEIQMYIRLQSSRERMD